MHKAMIYHKLPAHHDAINLKLELTHVVVLSPCDVHATIAAVPAEPKNRTGPAGLVALLRLYFDLITGSQVGLGFEKRLHNTNMIANAGHDQWCHVVLQ